jgi:hypothetical protein
VPNLISQYTRRMTIEQRLAEIIRSFCADALYSTVNLNADLDVTLCVLAEALHTAVLSGVIADRLPGHGWLSAAGVARWRVGRP